MRPIEQFCLDLGGCEDPGVVIDPALSTSGEGWHTWEEYSTWSTTASVDEDQWENDKWDIGDQWCGSPKAAPGPEDNTDQ